MPRQEYEVTLEENANGTASFNVERTLADNNPVAWLQVICYDEDGEPTKENADEEAVIWGDASSLEGEVEMVDLFWEGLRLGSA